MVTLKEKIDIILEYLELSEMAFATDAALNSTGAIYNKEANTVTTYTPSRGCCTHATSKVETDPQVLETLYMDLMLGLKTPCFEKMDRDIKTKFLFDRLGFYPWSD